MALRLSYLMFVTLKQVFIRLNRGSMAIDSSSATIVKSLLLKNNECLWSGGLRHPLEELT